MIDVTVIVITMIAMTGTEVIHIAEETGVITLQQIDAEIDGMISIQEIVDVAAVEVLSL